MRILCVEDGSVDIDALENGELKDGQVLVYRQGSKPPFILEVPDSYTEMYQKFLYVWEQLKEYVRENECDSWFAEEAFKKMIELEEIWVLINQHEDK